MTLLDRYLARTVLVHTLMVMAVLLALMTIVTFIGQQDEIGQGTFGTDDAFMVTFLRLPQQAYELLPIGTLIGAILGLGGLARDSELTVIRAAGVTVARIALSAALAGFAVAALMWVLGEYLAPPAEQYARQHKIFTRHAQLEIAGSSSAWMRQGPWYINVRQQSAENEFAGVYLYGLDQDRRLDRVGRAESASQEADGRWVLSRYAETRLADGAVSARNIDREFTGAEFSSDLLGLAVTDPRAQPLASLLAHVRYLRKNGLDSRVWEIAFWSRISRLIAPIVVCVFAVPFAFGPLRSAGAGARTVLGILAGVLFILVTQTLENSGQVYELNPLFVAWVPTFVLAAVASVAIWRTR